MFALFDGKKRYVAWKKGEKYIVGDFAVLSEMKEGRVKLGLREYVSVKSNLYDYLFTIRRNAQIIDIKDSSYLIARCGIRAGSVVVEGGVGSGALTTALLYFTYPSGRVYTYEKRRDFAEFAKKNVERIEYSHWTLKMGDVTTDVEERDVDAFVVDIPEPWEAVEMAKKALRNGGCFSSYVPTYNQMEKVYKKMQENGFGDMEACEIIKRNMHVGELGTRPENIEVAHTGFLIFGRKM